MIQVWNSIHQKLKFKFSLRKFHFDFVVFFCVLSFVDFVFFVFFLSNFSLFSKSSALNVNSKSAWWNIFRDGWKFCFLWTLSRLATLWRWSSGVSVSRLSFLKWRTCRGKCCILCRLFWNLLWRCCCCLLLSLLLFLLFLVLFKFQPVISILAIWINQILYVKLNRKLIYLNIIEHYNNKK